MMAQDKKNNDPNSKDDEKNTTPDTDKANAQKSDCGGGAGRGLGRGGGKGRRDGTGGGKGRGGGGKGGRRKE